MTEANANYNYTISTGFRDMDIFSADHAAPAPEDLLSNRLLPYRLPGGLELKNSLGNSDSNIRLSLTESSEPSIELVDDGSYVISGPLKKPEFVNQLPYLAYNLAEKSRQEELDMYSLHSASVATKDGRSILILGDKGSGKTILSIAFALNLEMGLIGNDLVSVKNRQGQLFAVSGSKVLDIRKAVLKYAFPEIIINEFGAPYEDKEAFIPEELGITLGDNSSGIVSVVRINLHPFNNKTILERHARRIQEVLRLRENFGRYIKGNVTPVTLNDQAFGGFFPSLDNSGLSGKRDEVIEQLMDLNFVYASGSNPRDVALEVANSCL